MELHERVGGKEDECVGGQAGRRASIKRGEAHTGASQGVGAKEGGAKVWCLPLGLLPVNNASPAKAVTCNGGSGLRREGRRGGSSGRHRGIACVVTDGAA